EALQTFYFGLWEIGGALALGVLLGFPMAYLTSHIYPGKSSQAEALGLVLLCAGLADWLEVSYILSAMMMGTVVANFTKHHRQRAFKDIEMFEWPLLILFFLLAGAALDLNALFEVGLFGLGYIVFRIVGRISGSYLGAKWAGCDERKYHFMGLAMLPHAGIPIGMALLAIQHFPELKNTVLTVILGATVVFELLGPPITRAILVNSGETQPPDLKK
ncbi:MAG: cation:proton antiporter, partial [Thiomicrorhabdus sp.]|nr:cation:proton antiporter [Thiomicrorhabdus sp.]